jgi:hypothetical protein
MTPIEILTATPELTAALTAVRDELMAANSAAIASATAAVNAERDKLKTDLADAIKASADALAAALATAKEAADKAAADAATAKAESDAALATANAARDKAISELAAMTAQDQQHAAALLVALDWQAIDAEYTDLQSKLAANSAKYDAARVKLEDLAAAINAPFAEREAAAKAARVKELEAQLAAVK